MDEPPVCFYTQGYDDPKAGRTETSGYWRNEPDFPVPGSTDRTLYLSPEGALDGDPPADEEGACDLYDYRPTVGICGGLWSGGVPFGLPTDQRPDELHSLTYTTEPLTEPFEILHRPRVTLYVSSTARVMAFVARLNDVAPDGTSALICTGVLNGTRRESLTEPSPTEPGRIYELTFDLDSTAWRFEPGHRIRLSIATADFPNLWPTPYPGTNRAYRGPAHPSKLVLPVIPSKKTVDQAAFEPAPANPEIYQLSPSEPPWEIAHDMLNDRTGLRLRMRSAARSNPTTESESSRDFEVWACNRDPANVRAVCTFVWRMVTPDATTAVNTLCSVRSTESAFHLTVDLNITVNDVPHHQNRWVRTFPRELL